MRYTRTKAAALAALTLVAAGCERPEGTVREAAASEAAAPRILAVTAGDFFFRTARSVPEGVTTIRLTNQGPDFHHVQLVRLAAGHTVPELLETMKTHGEHLPAWATLVGGPNSPAPGGTAEATLDLDAGEYALICIIPGPDGVPHVMKGMVVPLTVTDAAGAAAAAEPVADTRVVLDDYSFTISPELTAGKHTLRVENRAAQPHEIFLAKLEPGKGAGDLLAWIMKPEGPPPALPLGGTSALSTGESNYLTLDLAPGEYALYCFIPDHQDGQPHVAHGMVRQITVK